LTWKVLLPKFQNTELKKMISDYLTDKKDNYLLDLYHAASATLLVTGDKQILEQAPKFGFNAITLKQFEDQTN